MKVNFYEVDSLKKGLKKVQRKNRCLLSRKEKKLLKKVIDFLDSLEGLKANKNYSLRKSIDLLIKTILKMFV
jgi:hypothetical protein